ncbi:MAG: Multifunctional CCA protein [Holosporales bacterium]
MTEQHLKTYIVGGCVRDQLLKLPSKDRDHVVVGATPCDMVSLGFQQVGKDFPVFIHPKTREEYALARRERKMAPGYKGFNIDFSANVTLEEDLKRRDLTINAIAYDGENYIDPFNGQNDIANKILRPVGDAFSEDPVRILRLARFKTRFHDFVLHESCYKIAYSMRDELKHLKPERVRLELEKAFLEEKPSIFFKTLLDLNVLDIIFPSIFKLCDVEQPKCHHPEGDAFVHTLCVLDAVRTETMDLTCLYTALLHDIGKGLTPKNILPRHIGHELRGIALADDFIHQFGLMKHKSFILNFIRYHLHMHRLFDLKYKTVIDLLDAFKIKKHTDPSFKRLVICAKADLMDRHNELREELYLTKIIKALENLDYSNLPKDHKDIKSIVIKRKIDFLKSKIG